MSSAFRRLRSFQQIYPDVLEPFFFGIAVMTRQFSLQWEWWVQTGERCSPPGAAFHKKPNWSVKRQAVITCGEPREVCKHLGCGVSLYITTKENHRGAKWGNHDGVRGDRSRSEQGFHAKTYVFDHLAAVKGAHVRGAGHFLRHLSTVDLICRLQLSLQPRKKKPPDFVSARQFCILWW